MPFDGTISRKSDANTKEITALRRAVLADNLRMLPEGHTWNFGNYLEDHKCGTAGCAIGVAHLLWPDAGLLCEDEDDGLYDANSAVIFSFFGMTRDDAGKIFWGENEFYCLDGIVTPTMVADALEALNDS